MKRFRYAIVVVIIIAAISIGVPWYVKSGSAVTSSGITTSGFIEATSVKIVAEVGGRITSIEAGEGDSVEAGAVLLKLDDTLLVAQVEQARINLSLAQTNVDRAVLSQEAAQKAWENGRDVQLKIARVTLEQANTTFSKLTYPLTYSTLALDVPSAVAAINDAQRQLDEAQVWLKEGPDSDNYARAWEQFQKALDNLTTARERLQRGTGTDVFLSGRVPASDFYTLRNVQLEMEKAQLAVQNASAAVDQAYFAYQQAVSGVKIAREQVNQARAALDIVGIQFKKLTVFSPAAGMVTAKNLEVGEMATAGSPVLTVTALGKMTLTAYVPESQIGLVKLGQKAEVSIDSYPDQVFAGDITYISPQAVFTPGNIQLKDEREKMVFAVKISLANPDQKLKPGMPADATIITNS